MVPAVADDLSPVHYVTDAPWLPLQVRVRGDHLQHFVIGHVVVAFLRRFLDQFLFEPELCSLVDDIDAVFVERECGHTNS